MGRGLRTPARPKLGEHALAPPTSPHSEPPEFSLPASSPFPIRQCWGRMRQTELNKNHPSRRSNDQQDLPIEWLCQTEAIFPNYWSWWGRQTPLTRGYEVCARRTQVLHAHTAEGETSGSFHSLGLPGPSKPPATAQEADDKGGLG